MSVKVKKMTGYGFGVAAVVGLVAVGAALLQEMAAQQGQPPPQVQQQGGAAAAVLPYVTRIDSQESFSETVAWFGEASGEAVELASYFPFWLDPFPWLRAQVTAPTGAGRGGAAPPRGGAGPSPGEPLVLSAPRVGAGGASVELEAAWDASYPLPGGAIDIFGKPCLLARRWCFLGRRELTADELLARRCVIVIDLPQGGGDWSAAGFFTAANLTDTDQDGLTDAYEKLVSLSDPYSFSSAGDFMGDGWKVKYHLDPNEWLDPDADPDGDSLSNYAEFLADSDPRDPDSDGDGALDGADPDPLAPYDGADPYWLFKVINKIPLNAVIDDNLDTDQDGWPDWQEVYLFGTDPGDPLSKPVAHPGGSHDWFKITVTLNAPVPHPGAVLCLGAGGGERRLLLRDPGAWDVWLRRGEDGAITFRAQEPMGFHSVAVTTAAPAVILQYSPPAPLGYAGGEGWTGNNAIGWTFAAGLVGVPSVTVSPPSLCFHSTGPRTLTARVDPPFLWGSFTWRYGDLRFTGDAFTITPDLDAMPASVTVEFAAGGPTYATNCPAAYCKRILPPTGEGHECGEDCHGHRYWCETCEVEYCGPPPHGCGEYGGTNAPPVNGTNVFYRGRVPVAAPYITPRFPADYVTFHPDGRHPGGTNHCDCGAHHHFPADFPCCACPAHKPQGGGEGATNHLRLVSADPGLTVRTGESTNLVPLNVGDAVMPGTAVHVTGLTPSSLPRDRHLVFRRDNGGTPEINAFTALDAPLWADFDLDGTHGPGDIAKSYQPPEEAWLIPAAPGVWRNMQYHRHAHLPGDAVLSLDGTPGASRLKVYANGNLGDERIALPGQALTNVVNYYAYLEALAPGDAKVTHSFTGTGVASNYTCSRSIPVTAVGITFKPITIEMDVSANLYNSCGMGPGGRVLYKIDVEPSSIPDADIAWSATQGAEKVLFPHGNTGRIVTVEGLSAGEFTLEAGIAGMTLNPKPSIKGEVLHHKVVPVTAWIVADDYGGNEAIKEHDLANLIAGVNWHLKQVAADLTVTSVNYTNRTEWLDITFTNGVHQGADDLMDICSGTGGLELYFIREFRDCTTAALSSPKGIIISTKFVFSAIPAHEVDHAFGLEDIYEEMEDDPMANIYDLPLQPGHLPLDWGGGYYPPGTKLDSVVSSLLMFGMATRNNIVIPSGHVYGIGYTEMPGFSEGDVALEIWEKRLVNVGLDGIVTRQPQHQ